MSLSARLRCFVMGSVLSLLLIIQFFSVDTFITYSVCFVNKYSLRIHSGGRFLAGAAESDAPGLHDAGAVGDGERHLGVLLYQQDVCQ